MKIKDEMFIIDERIRKENIKLKIEIIQKNREIERLKNIINKAIEFIYDNAFNLERNYQVDDLWYEIPELLNILDKGESND